MPDTPTKALPDAAPEPLAPGLHPAPPAAFEVLRRVFGFRAFRPTQDGIVGRLAAGEDAVLVAVRDGLGPRRERRQQ